MKRFMDEDFLLESETAQRLYHEHAAKMPILDFHSHVNPREIAEDVRYRNLAEAWLTADHYKWRLMRTDGVEEKYITGGRASGRDRFQKFAEMMPRAVGNPMYAWVHLELLRYFHSHVPLTGETAEEVWQQAGIALAEPDMTARGVLKKSHVRLLATVDDPADDLKWHAAIRADGCETACAWATAVTNDGPTALVLTRQNLPQYPESCLDAAKGAYILRDSEKEVPDVLLMASGSEVELIYKAADELAKEGIDARVISMPSFELFDKQPEEYKEQIMPKAVRRRVAVEALTSFGWHKYVGLDGALVTLDHFGASAPAAKIFEEFGFTVENVVETVKGLF